MFDRLAWRRELYERYLLGLDDDDDEEEEDLEGYLSAEFVYDVGGWYYRARTDDDEPPLAALARMADDIEAGRAEPPPRWTFERLSSGVQLWTTPSGRRYACDKTGELLPLR